MTIGIHLLLIYHLAETCPKTPCSNESGSLKVKPVTDHGATLVGFESATFWVTSTHLQPLDYLHCNIA